ncbi:hypothetical protein [Actinoallomurus oryzae]
MRRPGTPVSTRMRRRDRTSATVRATPPRDGGAPGVAFLAWTA